MRVKFKLLIHSIILVACVIAIHYQVSGSTNNLFVIYAILITLGSCGYCLILMQKSTLKRVIFGLHLMFIFTFSLVPLYNVFCDITGLNGKVDLNVIAANPDGIIQDRDITVDFDVTYNQQMAWQFKPQHQNVTLKPGQLFQTAYFAKNLTNKTMIAQAIPSISPSRASKYLKKVECFCFNHQKLGPSESANLGLQFYLDKDMPKDIKNLTLSYTLFDITKKARS